MSKFRINRKKFLQLSGAAVGSMALGYGLNTGWGGRANAQARSRPNILFICVDQLRSLADVPGDLPLPTLRPLAEAGRHFINYHVHEAPCGPSRSVIYTGQHIQKTGMYTNPPGEFAILAPGEKPLELDPAMPTIGGMLRNEGYYTAYKGKWHLSVINQKVEAAFPGRYPDSSDILEEYGFSNYNRDGEHTGLSWIGYGHDGYIAGDAVNLLYDFSQGSTDGRPWYLAVNFINPHDIMFYDATGEQSAPSARPNPIAPMMEEPRIPFFEKDWGYPMPRSFYEDDLTTKPGVQMPAPGGGPFGRLSHDDETSWRRYQNYYLNCIRDVDQHIATVLSALERFGLAENTIVIITSDHGEQGGAHRMRGKGADMYKETVRVPLIIRHPDVTGGGATEALAGAVDLAPTILGFAGVSDEQRAERYPELHGVDFKEAIADGGARTERDRRGILFNYMTPGNLRSDVPIAEDQRRIIIRGVHDGRYKFARYFKVTEHHTPQDWETLTAHNDLELYDTAADPDELVNLAFKPDSQKGLILALNAKVNALVEIEVGRDLGSIYPGDPSIYTL